MDRSTILQKIKKCLALSASSNEHEAAAALRQARKMMEEYAITHADLLTADVGESSTKASAKDTPSSWEVDLAQRVANAFACVVIFDRTTEKTHWRFVGDRAKAEVAGYTFDVLLRQAKRARATHIKAKLRRCKRATRIRRADLFCEGWVRAVAGTITAFAGTPQEAQAIQARMASYGNALTQGASRNRNEGRTLHDREIDDFIAGRDAGKDARLNRGVGADTNRPALTADANG